MDLLNDQPRGSLSLQDMIDNKAAECRQAFAVLCAIEALERRKPSAQRPQPTPRNPSEVAQENAEQAAERNSLYYKAKREGTLEEIARLEASDSISPRGVRPAQNNSGLRSQLAARAQSELFESLIAKMGPVEEGWTQHHRYTTLACRNLQDLGATDEHKIFFDTQIRPRLVGLRWAFTDADEAINFLSYLGKKIGTGMSRLDVSMRLDRATPYGDAAGTAQFDRIVMLLAARCMVDEPSSPTIARKFSEAMYEAWHDEQTRPGWDHSKEWPRSYALRLVEVDVVLNVWWFKKREVQAQCEWLTLRLKGPIAHLL